MSDGLDALIKIGKKISQQGWSVATSGNMSMRGQLHYCWITESGVDKSRLQHDNFICVDIHRHSHYSPRQPSAETELHTLIYRLIPSANVVLHTHSLATTLLSKKLSDPFLKITGYELQKALKGQQDHHGVIQLPIFDNSQNISQLADHIANHFNSQPFEYGFLLRGHGLTCWGENVTQAWQHLSALEFLIQCEWQSRCCDYHDARNN